MAYEMIPIPNSSKVIHWDTSLPINQNILANLKGVRDDGEVIIPAYIEGKHSSERMDHAKNIIKKLESHAGIFLPHEIEDLLNTLPSHGKDGKPSLLYAIIQQAVRASTDEARSRNQQLAKAINEEKSQNQQLTEKENDNGSTLKSTRIKKIDSDIALLDAKKAVENLENEASRLDAEIVALENQMRILGTQSTQIHRDQLAIKNMSGPEVIQYFQTKLDNLEASIQSIPIQHQELVLKLDHLRTHQLAEEQSKQSTVNELYKSIEIVIEKLKTRLTPFLGDKKQGPGFFRGEAPALANENLAEDTGINNHATENIQEWDIKDNLWFNLQNKLTFYLNNGTHSPGRIKSAKSVLAKIQALHQSKLPDDEIDRALLDFIREQTISSHGFNGKASDLHSIYRNAELFSRERVLKDILSKNSELSTLSQTNLEIQHAIEQKKIENEKLQKSTQESEAQSQALSLKESELKRNIQSKKEKIAGLKEQIILKEKELQKGESVNDTSRFARLSNDSKGREQVRKLREKISTQKKTKTELEEQLPSLTQEVENLERSLATLKEKNDQKENEIRLKYLEAKKLSRKIDPANTLTGDAEKYPITSLVTSAEGYIVRLEKNERLEQSPQRKRVKTSASRFDTPAISDKLSQNPQGSGDDTSEDTEAESEPLSPNRFKNNPFAE